MAAIPPVAIVLAVGGAVVGGPEALSLLFALGHEGRSTAAVDVTICVFLFFAFTALLLGTLLLARFFRDAGAHPVAAGAAAAAPAPATERFAKVTLTVAFAVLFLVTSCLIVVPSNGNLAGTGSGGGVCSCAAA